MERAKEECKIDVNVGWVNDKIVDKEENSTSETKFRAFLALTDKIPLIVGFKDLLERYSINIDTIKGDAFIETK
ncbi:MAG: hypothetical protein ACE5KE_05105 [Methanosarcinales archaeon]